MAMKPEKYAAIKEMADFLDKGERPLALISDSHDSQEVAKHLENQRLGTSLVLANSLLAAADYEQDISLAALTYVNQHYQLAKNVASMRLLVQIYSLIRKGDTKFKFASAASFRDILLEVEKTGKGLPDKEIPDGDAYAAELGFVQLIWKKCMQDRHSKRADRLKVYAKKLQEAKTPVAYLHWGDPDEQIMAFIKECASAQVFEAKLGGKAKELENCWSGSGETQERSPLAYEAQTLEEAARASQKMLRQWLHKYQGKQDFIGILYYDRALVRRLHSLLLQEDQIFLQETTGWPANNLLVGKALLALASGAPRTELISKLQNVIVRKQGYKWAGLPRDLALGKIGQDWQKEVDGLEKKEVERLARILDNFTEEGDQSKSSPSRISDWFGVMAEESETGFLKEFFEQDAAAKDLRPLLHMLADEFAELEQEEDEGFRVGEVRRLLFDSLSSIDLRSSNNDSRVQLVRPGRFTTREFKAMLLTGADASTLPLSRGQQLLSDNARKEYLSLPTREEQIKKQRKSTALLLDNSDEVGAVWYGQAGISPYIDLMSKETKLLKRLDTPWKNIKPKPPCGSEAKLPELPEAVSVSACGVLLACPYKYHARHVLRLRKDAPSAIGQRNKYGSFVHALLEDFHNQLKPGFSNKKRAELLGSILNDARDGKGDKFKNSYFTEAERRYFAWEFAHYLEIYVAEINKLFSKEDGGKQFKGIQAVEKQLEVGLIDGTKITGKPDRVDDYGQEGYAIIDVKTGDPDKYKDYKTDPQLPLYMKLYKNSGETVCSKHSKFWVLSLEAGANKVVRTPDPNNNKKGKGDHLTEKAMDEVFKHYKEIFTKIGKQKPLPANGVQSVCQYCEYGGLCRKKHWGTDETSKKKDENA